MVFVRTAIPHLLHIDPNEADRIAFSQAFAKSGILGGLHSLSTASNALLFLNQMGPFAGLPRPQLIVLDLNLPRCNGRDFVEMLRANWRFKDMSIVVLMSTQNDVDRERCRKLGVDNYLAKPHNEQGYIDMIRTIVHEIIKV
jgi:CheY-like chemotaxis protein